MERIRTAIEKARSSRGETTGQPTPGIGSDHLTDQAVAANEWEQLEVFRPRLDLMVRNRIVTFDQKDNAKVPFDMMRTRMLSACRQNDWTVIGITSPTANCGKTLTAVNLAFSMSRQKDARTVLMDLDLRRPMIAETLGVNGNQSMGQFLSGEGEPEDHFLAYGDNLAIGTNKRRSLHSAEILQDACAGEALAKLRKTLQPNIILLDMPPMLSTDDVMAFLPNIDATLLVVSAGESKKKDVDFCERELASRGNVMGVILNKCRFTPDDSYYNYM